MEFNKKLIPNFNKFLFLFLEMDKRVSQVHSFLIKRKRGQFYLIAAVIIIALISGLAVVTNYSIKKTGYDMDYAGRELSIESEKVLDYGLLNSLNLKSLMENFTKTYSNYSDADEIYFIFGNLNEVTVAGYKKLDSGSILVDVGNGNRTITLSKGVYNSLNFSVANGSIEVTAGGIEYNFTLYNGENFFFILSKEVEEEKYIYTNQNSGILLVNGSQGVAENQTGSGEILIISSNTTNYNIYESLNSPANPVNVTLTINSGVVVGSASVSEPALTTGNLSNGSNIIIVNNGYIVGKGGGGGNYPGGKTSGLPGGNGGNALEILTETSIKNTGIIGGGGGGGGAGGGSSCGECYDDPGAGGGGGAGLDAGEGGTSPGAGGTYTGSSGTLLSGGAGGTVGPHGGSSEWSQSGDGGNGGSLGSDGQNGETGNGYPGGVGENAGNAVTGNSLVTWTAQGDVRGSLV